jgi:hypothetical protein
MTEPYVEGTSAPRPYRIKSGAVGEPLVGKTVTCQLTDRFGVTVDTVGDVAILDDGQAANAGLIEWTPDVGDMTAAGSPYARRFIVTSGPASKPFPEGPPDMVEVYKP